MSNETDDLKELQTWRMSWVGCMNPEMESDKTTPKP